jgi:hypothetical protein
MSDLLVESVVSPNQSINGYSQAELSGIWLNYIASTPNPPDPGDPSQDLTGESAYYGQPVVDDLLFLAGFQGSTIPPIERTVELTQWTEYLFHPLINAGAAAELVGLELADLSGAEKSRKLDVQGIS